MNGDGLLLTKTHIYVTRLFRYFFCRKQFLISPRVALLRTKQKIFFYIEISLFL